MLEIDGSTGEGGGQIIRSCLSLSTITGKSFRIERIRAKRSKPGLLNQHLTAVRAAAQISGAEVQGDSLGSGSLEFHPGKVNAGNYFFDTGTAGSTMLVLQTVLPPLICAKEKSTVTLKGGTHNPMAPPFDFVSCTFLPILKSMGANITIELSRFGFYPKGGGKVMVRIEPPLKGLQPIELGQRSSISELKATALVVRLPESIAQREVSTLRAKLSKLHTCEVAQSNNSNSPGNAVFIQVRGETDADVSSHLTAYTLTETFSALGGRGIRAEKVAETAAEEASRYLESKAIVGEHLADQLLIPMAMSGSGFINTLEPSLHTRTNIDVISKFLPVSFDITQQEETLFKIEVKRIDRG